MAVAVRAFPYIVALGLCLPGCFQPALEVGPGENVVVDEPLNGDLSCDGGNVMLEPGASVNGDLLATDCSVIMFASANGWVHASGGKRLYISGAGSINGEVEAIDVRYVEIQDTSFNGGLRVEGAWRAEISNSGFNGGGRVRQSGDVAVFGNRFNGDLTIDETGSCAEGDNLTNGGVSATDCAGG